MKKTGNKFKNEIKILLAQHGRKLDFICKSFGISRQWFHARLNAEDFDEIEKEKLRKIIIGK